jgi:hypothetical protein
LEKHLKQVQGADDTHLEDTLISVSLRDNDDNKLGWLKCFVRVVRFCFRNCSTEAGHCLELARH